MKILAENEFSKKLKETLTEVVDSCEITFIYRGEGKEPAVILSQTDYESLREEVTTARHMLANGNLEDE